LTGEARERAVGHRRSGRSRAAAFDGVSDQSVAQDVFDVGSHTCGDSAQGVAVFSYAAGANGTADTWSRAPNAGAFVDAPNPSPGW
jgi:hypothetical protein